MHVGPGWWWCWAPLCVLGFALIFHCQLVGTSEQDRSPLLTELPKSKLCAFLAERGLSVPSFPPQVLSPEFVQGVLFSSLVFGRRNMENSSSMMSFYIFAQNLNILREADTFNMTFYKWGDYLVIIVRP